MGENLPDWEKKKIEYWMEPRRVADRERIGICATIMVVVILVLVNTVPTLVLSYPNVVERNFLGYLCGADIGALFAVLLLNPVLHKVRN